MPTLKLSSGQESILLTQSIYHNSTLYSVAGYAKIEGMLDVILMSEIVNSVLDASDAIKLGVNALSDTLSSLDLATVSPFEILDFSESRDPDAACLEWIGNAWQRRNGYDVKLLKAGGEKYYWYSMFHHIIFDGYSMSLFFNIVARAYKANLNNSGALIMPEILKYADFVQDEAEYKLSENYFADKVFWAGKLNRFSDLRISGSHFPQVTGLRRLHSKRAEILIPRPIFEEIESFCKGLNVTVLHYFLGSLLILHKRYYNSMVTIGLPVFNRGKKVFKETLGMFVNTLPFFFQFDEAISTEVFLREIKRELNECYRHIRLPLKDIMEATGQVGNIYDITFSYQKNHYHQELGNSPVNITYLHAREQDEKLVFHLLEYSEKDDLTLFIDYSTSLFSDDQIAQMSSHYYILLEKLKTNRVWKLSEVEHLTEKEMIHVIEENLKKELVGSESLFLLKSLRNFAANTPEESAMLSNGIEFSYGYIDQKSSAMALYLHSFHSIGKNDRVGIRFSNPIEVLVSVLGVMKLGATCVMIDPLHGERDVEYIIFDSNCKIALNEDNFSFSLLSEQELPFPDPEIDYDLTDIIYLVYPLKDVQSSDVLKITHSSALIDIIWDIPDIMEMKTWRFENDFEISVKRIFSRLKSFINKPKLNSNSVENLFGSAISDDF